jgi:hypothetical protein
MCSRLLALLVVLTLLLMPGAAIGRTEYHQFSQRERLLLELNRHAERLDKQQRGRTHWHFQLDVFQRLSRRRFMNRDEKQQARDLRRGARQDAIVPREEVTPRGLEPLLPP